MESRRAGEQDEEFKPLRRGWFFGEKPLRRELLSQMTEQRGEWHYGEELQESAEERAEQVIRAELKGKGWTEKELRERRKEDAFKVRLAERLRRETMDRGAAGHGHARAPDTSAVLAGSPEAG